MNDPLRARLVWRCRRGMRELDVLLLAWLQLRFEAATASQRMAFQSLLELPDPQLQRYLLGGQRPATAEVVTLVDDILEAQRIMSTRGGNLPRG